MKTPKNTARRAARQIAEYARTEAARALSVRGSDEGDRQYAEIIAAARIEVARRTAAAGLTQMATAWA